MAASRWACTGALGVLVLCARPSPAQRTQSSLDIGAVTLRYADSLNISAATLTPDVRFDWERAITQVTGTFSQFTDGSWSTQAALSGSVFTATRRSLLGELAGVAGGSAHQDGTRTGQAIGNIRLHSMRSTAGVFAGAGAGGTWDGSAWRRLVLGEIGGWTQSSSGTALLTITPVAVDDSVRYVDGQITVSREFNNVDVSAVAGGRGGGQNPAVGTRARSWGSLSAVAWIRPRTAIAASGGTYPVDPTQGFPGGRFLSVSVRLATSQRRVTMVPGRDSGNVAERVAVGRAPFQAFRVDRQTAGFVQVRFHAPTARLVEITGDFTGWAPVRLQAAGDGWWTARFRLESGKHEMNMRVDSGGWVVPPGLLPLNDEFGGSVGLLVVD